MRFGELGSLDLAAGADMWRVNVAAAMLLADTLAPTLPRGGRIVLIGSRTASGVAGRSQYVATKSALIGMARSWAMELAPRGHHRQCRISECDRKRRCCSIRPQQLRLVFLRSGVSSSRKKLRRPPRFCCPKRLQRSQARW